jgi:DNA polymerase elongation subunit (family B)
MFTTDNLHGKVIYYNNIKKLPNRNSYLDKDKYAKTNEQIKKGSPLLFMTNDLHEMHLQNKKYDKSLYKIVLFGVLIDGRESKIVISGIKPYFEAVVLSTEIADQLNKKLSQLKYGCPSSYEIVRGKQFKGFRKDRQLFARFYFRKLNDRKEAIKYIRSQGYETTSDDINSYYRVVCRDYMISFSTWAEISNYTVREYSNIRGPVYDVNIQNFKLCKEDIMNNTQLAKDNTMTCCWDIETYSPDGQLPKPENLDHKMFMIGITFQWHHANKQLLRACLIDHSCKPKPNYITIVCDNEKKLIKAFGKIVHKMKPDIILGFNDADYDWPWLIKRSMQYPGTLAFIAECFDRTSHWKNYNDADVFKYNFKREKVKLEADAYADGQTLQFPGYLNIDVRTMFRQLYPTAEKSNLNFYLNLNKLQPKKDMPYKEMFRIYRELDKMVQKQKLIKTLLGAYNGLSQCNDTVFKYYNSQLISADDETYDEITYKMAEVADYCVIDSQRCHELMKMRSVIMDRREIANLSYTSMYDALYRANGMKVRNIVIARGQKRGIKFSNITNSGYVSEGKYPGAYVFPPKKGLVTSKLTIAERINLGLKGVEQYKEWVNITKDDIKSLMEIIELHGVCLSNENIQSIEVYKLPQCLIEFLKEHTGRPITGLDFSSLYPSLIMTYNLSPEYIITNKKEAMEAHAEGHNLYKIKFDFDGRVIRGWAVRHDNKLDPNSSDCKFGIYPMILKELFDTRKIMKKELHKWENQKEQMEALSREEFDTVENQSKYEDICFNFDYVNSKQKGIKLFMNTFYGESGNKRSPFFVLQLAGAITTAGQDNIKMVQKFVEDRACGVQYGDSVTGDTPLVLRNPVTNLVYIKTIDDLVAEDAWKSYDNFKPGEPDRINKQQGECTYQIWSEGNWREIRRVIRHKTNKKMYRVNTHTGCIDVTADHSLMRPDRTKIKPSELQIGTELMHSFPEEFPHVLQEQYKYINSMNSIAKEEAYVWGFFMATGSCGDHQCSSGIKLSWVINNQNIKYLNQTKEYLAICEPHIKFKLLNAMDRSGVYKLVAHSNVKLIVSKYNKLFYTYYKHDNTRKYKLVPVQILNGSLEVRRSFYDGYYVGDGCKPFKQNIRRSEFCCKGKITSQCMYYLVKSLGYKYTNISTRDDNPNIYKISPSRTPVKKNPTTVKKILELPKVTQETFVYDIETSQGSFLGGVGALICFNTDSCYLSMPEKHFREIDIQYYTEKIVKETYWTNQVNITFDVIKVINKDVNEMLIADNGTQFLKMNFEEALYPVAFLAKKKYYGIPHISIPNFNPKNLFIRGLEVKKRGISDMLKKVCMSIMWDSVSLVNQSTLMELVETKVDEIYTTNWDFKDFIKSAVFKPNKQNVSVHTFAQRMLNINIKVKPFERFQYVIVQKNPYKYDYRGRKKPLQIGDKMEYTDRAQTEGMTIDLDYYMTGSVVGQLARLITYSSLFHVESESDSSDDRKTADDKIYKNAVKYVDNYCNKYYTKYQSKGKIYQKIFKIANKAVINSARQIIPDETIEILNSSYDIDNLSEWLEEKAKKKAIRDLKGCGSTYIQNELEKIPKKDRSAKLKSLQDIYFARQKTSLLMIREKAFNNRRELLQRQVQDNIVNLTKVLNQQTRIINRVSKQIKIALDIDNKYNDAGVEVPEFDTISKGMIDDTTIAAKAEQEFEKMLDNEELCIGLNKMRYIYLNMISNFHFICKTRQIVDYLKITRNKKIQFVAKPATFDTKSFIKFNVDALVEEIVSSHIQL